MCRPSPAHRARSQCGGARHTDAAAGDDGTLVEAINLYRSAGYVEVAAFSDEPYAHHWFEKQLG